MQKLPAQKQLLVPLLQCIEESGGRQQTKKLYRDLADRLEISSESRQSTTHLPSGEFNLWERQVRWTQQRAKLLGFLLNDEAQVWRLTEAGTHTLLNIRPGAVITVYEDEKGVALWAEAEAAVGTIQNDSIQAIITSPPYPLLRKKDYANQKPEADHVQWLLDFFASARQKLCPSGSLILNLGPVWRPGQPTMSLYAERLLIRLCDEAGYHLAMKLFWYNPAKLPGPAEWVTIRRVRVTPAVEEVFWLSRGPNPKANNRKVLRPYSLAMQERLQQGGEVSVQRPSGHRFKTGAFAKDNGGAIAHNMLMAANTASNGAYQQFCRQHNLPIHPARFPAELPEFFIKFLTDPDDIIWDPFAGSLETAAAAQRLGRRWIANDKSLRYLQGGVGGKLIHNCQ